MAFNNELGAEIRRVRKAAGMSQIELSQTLGWNKNMIGRYERGEDTLSAERLADIARALATPEFLVGTLRILFEGDGMPPSDPPQQLEFQFDDEGGVTLRIQPTTSGVAIRRASTA